MQSAERVVRNTGFLYGKMFITILISLYSTRLILNALGEVDYGIFNLIGGVVAMLSFINGAMIIATQRYLSFFLGAGDMSELKAVFNSSVVLHLIIGLIIILLLEFAGLFLFNNGLNIPQERIGVAKIVFHFMVVSTFFTINAVPYDASINAHENMLFDALVGVFESFIKLGIAIYLVYAKNDKLILYGILIAGLTILIRIIKSFYCLWKYEECRVSIRTHLKLGLLKEMLAFAGWNLFGLFSSVLKNQGLAILLNLFFGVIVNAAYGIANTVNANLRNFSTNMIRAIMPQITKSEGSGDRERMLRLSMLASKMSFFLLAFFAIPIIIEMPIILRIWLKTVPENTVIFCQLILILSMIYQLTIGTMAAVTSVGDIRVFQIAVAIFEIFNIPLAYALIKFGLPAYSVFVGAICMELVAGSIRIWYAHKIAGLDIKEYVIKTWFNSILTAALTATLAMSTRLFLSEGLFRLILVLVLSPISLMILAKSVALTKGEFKKIKEIIESIFSSVRKIFVLI